MKKFILFLGLIVTIFSSSLKAEEENVFIACDNGLEMFGWDLEFIRHATQSIEVAACFAGGTIIRELLETIEARMEVCPKLKVYILATPILLEKEDKIIIERLEKKFGDRFHLEHATNILIVWPDVTGIDNHVKMLVVDETYFSAGGTNLARTPSIFKKLSGSIKWP